MMTLMSRRMGLATWSAGALLLGIASSSYAQMSLVITGLQSNGEMSWTNQESGATYGVQWTDVPGGAWRMGWHDLRSMVATSSAGRAQVPVFFRLARVPADGLVAHYRFTCDASDSTTNANHGTVSGATLAAGRTADNPAYEFDGVNDLIACGTNAVLELTNKFTLSAWFFLRHTNSAQTVLAKWSASPEAGYTILVANFGAGYVAASTLNNSLQTYGPVTTGEWHHVVLTRDFPLTVQYMNGERVYVKTNYNAVVATTNALVIGSREKSAFQLFDGWIDDVRIYNRLLSADEVATLYRYESP